MSDTADNPSNFDVSIEAEVDRALDRYIRGAGSPSVHWIRAERMKWRPIFRRAAINRRLFYGGPA
jgi:hypothetical protein